MRYRLISNACHLLRIKVLIGSLVLLDVPDASLLVAQALGGVVAAQFLDQLSGPGALS